MELNPSVCYDDLELGNRIQDIDNAISRIGIVMRVMFQIRAGVTTSRGPKYRRDYSTLSARVHAREKHSLVNSVSGLGETEATRQLYCFRTNSIVAYCVP
jgi:hypothetical protein